MDNKSLAKMIGKAIFYSSITFSIGSIEMSSRFSVLNFSKDQTTLDNACIALRDYIAIATIWALACILVLYASYGLCGAVFAGVCNVVFMGWIITSYLKAFQKAAEKYNLKYPGFIGMFSLS